MITQSRNETKHMHVDYSKLKSAIENRGFTMREVSRGLGMSASYLSNAKGSGYITVAISQLLEYMYGIKPEEYERDIDDNVITIAATESLSVPNTVELNDNVYEAIKQIVKEAVLEAFAEL